jgi:hypothetical protein
MNPENGILWRLSECERRMTKLEDQDLSESITELKTDVKYLRDSVRTVNRSLWALIGSVAAAMGVYLLTSGGVS